LTTILQQVDDRDAVIALHRLFSGQHMVCEVGQKLPRWAWVVAERPSDFVAVAPADLDRADAVRCLSAVDVPDESPNAAPWMMKRVAWPGQWLHRDDPIVLAHPRCFAPLEERR
jgi:hypothetical protein